MTEGLFEGLSGSLGDELSRLGGLRSTRVQVQLEPGATRLDYGTDDASSNAAGTVITLGPQVGRGFAATIAAGQRFRALSPLLSAPSVSAPIVSRDSATQLTIGGGVFDATLIGVSWEVYDPALIQVLQVETTFGWADNGQFVWDGGLYRYTGRTLNHLHNLEYFNGEVWTYQLRTDRPFEVGDEIVDFSRVFSAVETMRRSFLVEYATGEDLDVVGSNLGVRRPSTANDDVYRRIIKALAYVPRGTMWVIELLLDAVLGSGNYEVFEDLTQRSPTAPLTVMSPHFQFSANHPAQVFVSAQTEPLRSAGKTFVEALERRPLLAPRIDAVTLTEVPIKVVGVTPAKECFERLIASGTGAMATVATTVAGVPTELAVDLEPALPSGVPLRGDAFFIDGGALVGRVGHIASVVGPTEIILADFEGAPALDQRRAFTGLPWRIVREKTEVRHHYRPSEDLQIEYPGGPARQMWFYDGADLGDPIIDPNAEATYVTFQATVDEGKYIQIDEPPSNDSQAFYRQRARVIDPSFATFEALVRINGGSDAFSSDRAQFMLRMSDETRDLSVGMTPGPGLPATTIFGFVDTSDPTLPFLLPSSGFVVEEETWHTLEIKKYGTDRVELWGDGRVREIVPWTDFPPVSPAMPASERRIGNFLGSQVGIQIRIKHLDWSACTEEDLWNHRVPSGGIVAANAILTDTGGSNAFTNVVVTDLVHITRASVLGAAGGDARGEWEISSVLDPNNVQIERGRRRYDGTVDVGQPLRFRSEDDLSAFRFPQDLGNRVEVLTGPNAGTQWTITAILDSRTGRDLATLADGVTDANFDVDEQSPLVAVVPVAPATTLTPQQRFQWHKRFTAAPVSDPDVTFAVVDQGIVAGLNLTLPQDFPIALYPEGDGPLVEVRYTRVLSAQVEESSAMNAETVGAPGYTHFPFYLADDFGWATGLLDVITVAGVHVNLRSFFRDAAGPHVR